MTIQSHLDAAPIGGDARGREYLGMITLCEAVHRSVCSRAPTLGDLIAMPTAWAVAYRLFVRVSADYPWLRSDIAARLGEG